MHLMQLCRIDHHTFTVWHIICLTFGNCPIWIPSGKILQMQFLFLSVLPNVRGGGNQNHAWPLAAVRYFAKNRYDIRTVCWKLFWSFQRFAKLPLPGNWSWGVRMERGPEGGRRRRRCMEVARRWMGASPSSLALPVWVHPWQARHKIFSRALTRGWYSVLSDSPETFLLSSWEQSWSG
jgi:hypothetical protein